MPNFLINTDKKLLNISDDLMQSSSIGVDTEFIRESTYYPKLALIQFATEHNNYIVDTLSISAHDIIVEILTNKNIIKVLHSAKQDLETIHHHFNCFPVNLFDTQIAFNLTSALVNPSYSSLVKKYFSKELKEGSWRTDWLKRPLSDDKIEYAANDVEYLVALSQSISSELKALDRFDWLAEEHSNDLSARSIITDPFDAWKRISIPINLDYRNRSNVRSIAAWREITAQKSNIPKKWILTDGEIVRISCSKNENVSKLLENTKFKISDEHKDNIVMLLEQNTLGEKTPEKIDMNLYNKIIGKCNTVLNEVSEKYNIASSLIANKRDIDYFARGEKNIRFLKGWRFKIFGKLVQ